MKIEEQFDLRMCVLESLDEMRELDSSCDFAEIEGKYPEFGFVRPRKISWRAYLENLEDPYAVVQSKKLRKLIKRWEQEMPVHGLEIRIIESLDEAIFQEWLETYNKLIGEKERSNFAITKDWLTEKQKAGKNIVGVFLYHGSELLGGNICTLQTDKLSIGFGVVNHLSNLNWNLGALLDFLTIKYGGEKGYKIISFGRDTNLYGLHLSAGLFSYKSRLGLTPAPVEKTGWVTTKFLKYDKFMDPIVFMTEDSVITILYRNELPEVNEYMAKGIKSVDITKVEQQNR